MDVAEDQSERLAARLEMTTIEFVEIFGSGWTKLAPEELGVGEVRRDYEWHVSGEPAQLMPDVGSRGPRVARPQGR